MRNVFSIVERELRAYFASPIAYAVLTIFVFLSGLFFQIILTQIVQEVQLRDMQGQRFGTGPQPVDMPGFISQRFLGSLSVILLFMLPMITMALFSEEKRRGTIELLLTAPLTDLQVVMGKYLAAVSFYGIMLATTFVPISILFIYSEPAAGPILTGYLGLFLYGVSLLAVGLFISTLTENQIIAGAVSFAVAMMLWLVDALAANATSTTRAILTHLSLLGHLDDFIKGVLSTPHVIFYLSLTTLGLFLTYRSIESMRWRG